MSTETENQELDKLVWEIAKSFESRDGATKAQIKEGVAAVVSVPDKNVDYTIKWLVSEGCITEKDGRFHAVEWDTMAPLP